MLKMGDFAFGNSGQEGKNKVYFEGEREDGTKIKITIEKDDNYKSPAEIAEAEKEAENAN